MGTIWKINIESFHQDSLTQPKYKVLADYIEAAISSGELLDQQKLPAQRLLADQLAVTHGTVTRAYALAEKRGIVIAKLGAGTYVNTGLIIRETTQCIDFSASMQPMLGQQNILSQAMHELANDSRALIQMMAYCAVGINRHKQVFSQWLNAKGIENDPNKLIFTQGAQQGIYTALQALAEPGELVLHEQLCYPGLFKAASVLGLNTASVPLTSEGIDLDKLEKICQTHQVKVLYITPNMQNPTNTRYSNNVLQKLVDLSKEYLFYIIEDDVNYCPSQYWRPPFQQQAPERIIYLSSLSKYFAGGLRIGYMLAPQTLQSKLSQFIHGQCWMVSTMNFELACRFIESKDYQQNQQKLEQELKYRQQVFIAMLTRHNLTANTGGLNIWLELPLNINMHHLSGLLLAENIKVRTADIFTNTNDGAPSNALRIAIGGPDTRQLFDQGVKIFSQVLAKLQLGIDAVI